MKKIILITLLSISCISVTLAKAIDTVFPSTMGLLGHTVGTHLLIEGTKPELKPNKKTMGRLLVINSVNGKKLSVAISIPMKNADIDILQPGTQFILEGYEYAEWVGCPTCQSPRQVMHYFVVTKARVPDTLKIEKIEQ